jgi:hypothetical protein
MLAMRADEAVKRGKERSVRIFGVCMKSWMCEKKRGGRKGTNWG